MFSRLFNVRLKAAEKALKSGHLDEAFRLATAPDLRQHDTSKTLLQELADKFIQRAREHLDHERFAEALADLDKADIGAKNPDRITEMRKNVQIVAHEVQRLDRSRRRRLDEARHRMEAGSLQAGRQILNDAHADDPEAKRLAEDIRQRERQADHGFAEVEKLLKDGQLPAAIARFRKTRRLTPLAPQALALESALCAQALTNARHALETGRINRATEELAALTDIARTNPARRDLEELVELARSAARSLGENDFETARRQVMRMRGLGFHPAWVAHAADQLEKLDHLLTSLHGGPLAEAGGTNPPRAAAPPPPAQSVDLNETVALDDRSTGLDLLPTRLLMLVDGGGSYLILRKDRATIGRAITQNPADIPIRSDLAERHAEIARVDDDYFLFGSRDIDIDGRPTRHHLLRSGNRLTLTRNAAFTFRLPHRQSASGLLESTSSTHMPNDVRRVILFKQTAMIGFGNHVHVMCNGAVHDLILFERAGRLWVRPQRNGRIDTQATPIELGTQMELFNVSFIIQPWTMPTFGPTVS